MRRVCRLAKGRESGLEGTTSISVGDGESKVDMRTLDNKSVLKAFASHDHISLVWRSKPRTMYGLIPVPSDATYHNHQRVAATQASEYFTMIK